MKNKLTKAIRNGTVSALHIDIQEVFLERSKREGGVSSRSCQSAFNNAAAATGIYKKLKVPNIWVAFAGPLRPTYPPRSIEGYKGEIEATNNLHLKFVPEAQPEDTVLIKHTNDLFSGHTDWCSGMPTSKDLAKTDDGEDFEMKLGVTSGNPFLYLTKKRGFNTFLIDGVNAHSCVMDTIDGIFRQSKKHGIPIDIYIVPEAINIQQHDGTMENPTTPQSYKDTVLKTYPDIPHDRLHILPLAELKRIQVDIAERAPQTIDIHEPA